MASSIAFTAFLLLTGSLLVTSLENPNGIFKKIFSKVQNDEAGQDWTVNISITNFNTVLGFSIFFYIDEFGFGDDVTVTGYSGNPTQIDIFPISTLFEGNSVQGGTLQSIDPLGDTKPVWITPNCNFTAPTMSPDACLNVDPELIISVNLVTAQPITGSQLLVGGPRTTSPDRALFAFDQTISVSDNNALSPPPPSPPAAPPLPGRDFTLPPEPPSPPPQGVVKSDPHITGFNGAKFDFIGKPGKIYNLVTNYIDDDEADIVINVELARAYTTGLSKDETTLGLLPYIADGTWVKATGIVVNGLDIVVSVARDSTENHCSVEDDMCLRYGALSINNKPVTRVGLYEFGNDIEVEIKNSKTYSRLMLRSDVLRVTMDVVRPPLLWEIDESYFEEFSHINLSVDYIVIKKAKGILGETAHASADDATHSESYESNIVEEAYEVEHLTTPLSKR